MNPFEEFAMIAKDKMKYEFDFDKMHYIKELL